MNLLGKIQQLEQLDQLIRLKATGSPKELARRINLSLRHTFRLISEMKEIGLPIQYCKKRCSYYYSDSVKIHFEIRVEEEHLLKVTV